MADPTSSNGRGRLFEYAVLYHPKQTKEQIERGEAVRFDTVRPKSVLLVTPTTIMASSDQEVSIQAARAIPTEYLDKLEDVEIVVRPF